MSGFRVSRHLGVMTNDAPLAAAAGWLMTEEWAGDGVPFAAWRRRTTRPREVALNP